ncbi:MAG: ABC transporter substrate-binding protein [Bradyrhizobium sp.]|nr:ABC transporter substrate-binding protein [Bradyrhizobium sp.]
MRRRDFIVLAGGAAAVWPLVVRAQPAMPVIGILAAGSQKGDEQLTAALLKGLAESGYEDGRNVRIEYRWADSQYDRLPAMATDLVLQKVAVIAATTTPAAKAAKEATTTIPVVFTTISDPVQIGFVASLNRPGGNVTGSTLLSVRVGPKLLELLRGAVPSATVMGLLVNPANPNAESQTTNMHAAARGLGLQLEILKASAESEFDAAFAQLRERRISGLIIGQDVLFNAKSAQLAALTLRHAIPAVAQLREFAVAGGLISYGASRSDSWRQAGIYVGRILKGEKPSELPVMQPTKFEMTVNLKTAKALGLNLPYVGLAEEVIE